MSELKDVKKYTKRYEEGEINFDDANTIFDQLAHYDQVKFDKMVEYNKTNEEGSYKKVFENESECREEMQNALDELEKNKEFNIEKIKKEKKLDIGKEVLNKRKTEAELEIRNHGEGSKEASQDLKKINAELEKIETEEQNIVKDIETKIKNKKLVIMQFDKEVRARESLEKRINDDKKTIEHLEKEKSEAELEMKNHGEGSKEASQDLEKINQELKTRGAELDKEKYMLEAIKQSIHITISKFSLEYYLKHGDKTKNEVDKEKENTKVEKEEQLNKKSDIRKDLDERTEKAIETPKTEEVDMENIEEKLKQNADKVIKETKTEMQPKTANTVKKQNYQPVNTKAQENGKIVGINIREGSDSIDIIVKGDGNKTKTLTKKNVLNDLLKESKRIFNEPNIASSIEAIEPKKIKRFFFKRKLNPVILEALNDFEQNGTIIEYLKSVKTKQKCESLNIKHDLNQTVLTGKNKRIMKRAGKAESKIEGVDVYGLDAKEKVGLLGTGKRKIKNKPVTIKENTKLKGKIKTFDKVKDFSKKAFKAALKVPKTMTKVADYIGRDEDLEREVKQDDIDKDER